jgi:endonuclease/exonuclease/phosphatase family metal-dependent hydrolase
VTEPDRSATVRLLSYNVHGGRDDRGMLARIIRDARPDVVVVQEGPRRFRWRTKAAELAHKWGLVYAAGGLPSLGNLVVVSHRVRVLDTWSLRYPLTPGRHLRGAVFARCAIETRVGTAVPFTVAGTHLATDDGERPRQATAFLDAIAGVSEPVIAALDVNEPPDRPSWHLLTDKLDDAAAIRGDDRPTFPSGAPDRRLDAVFVDRRCTIMSYDVLGVPGTAAASDHRPVLADIRVPLS